MAYFALRDIVAMGDNHQLAFARKRLISFDYADSFYMHDSMFGAIQMIHDIMTVLGVTIPGQYQAGQYRQGQYRQGQYRRQCPAMPIPGQYRRQCPAVPFPILNTGVCINLTPPLFSTPPCVSFKSLTSTTAFIRCGRMSFSERNVSSHAVLHRITPAYS